LSTDELKTPLAGASMRPAAGLIDGFIHAYLGMPDARLPVPLHGLVPAEHVRNYPTNFRAMSEADLHAISLRGEQLTRSLLSYYCPEI
jgi:NTE family protein